MAIGRPINQTGNLATQTIGFNASANQTEFTIPGGYGINNIDVFRNGVKLTPQSDFEALDGTKVTLVDACQLNDEVSFKVYNTFSVADAIVGAASSQVINGDLTVTGTLYQPNAASVGVAGTWADFDGLTGITTTKKVRIQNNLQVTGVVTATSVSATSGSFSGDVSIGGTLTYEDVTNVDSVGIITAQSGVNVTGGSVVVGSAVTMDSTGVNVAGVVTSTSLVIGNNHKLFNQNVSTASANRITNGTWATGDSTGWTSGDSLYTEQFNNGGYAYIVTRTGGTTTNADYQTFSTTSGATYTVGFEVGMAGGVKVFSGSGLSGSVLGSASSSDESGAMTERGFTFTANASTATLSVQVPENGGTYMYDNVVVTEALSIPTLKIQSVGTGDTYASFAQDGSAILYYDNSVKLETLSTGVSVTGIVSATSLTGDGSSLTGVETTASYTLGANGTSDYTFTGPGLTGAENDPTIYLTRGKTYKFVNGMGAHPFRIQSTPNGSAGTAYNDGITNNNVSNGTLTWDVQFDAPDTLYYQCTAHSNMGGVIYIGDNSRSLPNIAKSSGYTLIKTDTNKLINMTSSGTVTVPSGIFSAGDIITVYNNNSSTMQVQASGTTLRKAGTSNTGTCTVDQYGTASILCVSSNEFVVSGNIS